MRGSWWFLSHNNWTQVNWFTSTIDFLWLPTMCSVPIARQSLLNGSPFETICCLSKPEVNKTKNTSEKEDTPKVWSTLPRQFIVRRISWSQLQTDNHWLVRKQRVFQNMRPHHSASNFQVHCNWRRFRACCWHVRRRRHKPQRVLRTVANQIRRLSEFQLFECVRILAFRSALRNCQSMHERAQIAGASQIWHGSLPARIYGTRKLQRADPQLSWAKHYRSRLLQRRPRLDLTYSRCQKPLQAIAGRCSDQRAPWRNDSDAWINIWSILSWNTAFHLNGQIRTVARKSSIRGLYICAGGVLTFVKGGLDIKI